MKRVRLTRLARQDLLEIWQRIAEDDMNAADRVYQRIERRLSEVATYPNLAVARPDIGSEAPVGY